MSAHSQGKDMKKCCLHNTHYFLVCLRVRACASEMTTRTVVSCVDMYDNKNGCVLTCMYMCKCVQNTKSSKCCLDKKEVLPAKTQKETEKSNLHGFELLRSLSWGTELLSRYRVIKALINQCASE